MRMIGMGIVGRGCFGLLKKKRRGRTVDLGTTATDGETSIRQTRYPTLFLFDFVNDGF